MFHICCYVYIYFYTCSTVLLMSFSFRPFGNWLHLTKKYVQKIVFHKRSVQYENSGGNRWQKNENRIRQEGRGTKCDRNGTNDEGLSTEHKNGVFCFFQPLFSLRVTKSERSFPFRQFLKPFNFVSDEKLWKVSKTDRRDKKTKATLTVKFLKFFLVSRIRQGKSLKHHKKYPSINSIG